MEHLSLFAFLLGSLTTLGAIAVTAMTRQVYPLKSLTYFATFLALVLSASLVDLSRQYIATNVGLDSVAVDVLMMIAIALPTLLAIYYLLLTGEELLQTNLRSYKITLGIAGTTGLGFILLNEFEIIADQLTSVVVLGAQFALLVIYLLLAWRLSSTKSRVPGKRHSALQLFGIWISAKSIADFTLVLISVGGDADFSTIMTFQGGIEVLAATAIIVFCRPFVRAIAPDAASRRSDAISPALIDDYGITRRESEILALATSGQSNKDIANTLSISPTTVRDHIYQIYKKTGVKNRVQLTNLFRQSNEAEN